MQTQTTTIVRTCDQCGKQVTLTGSEQHPIPVEQVKNAANWYTLVREHIVGDQLTPLAKLTCSTGCAIKLLEAGGLELPTPVVPNVIPWKN